MVQHFKEGLTNIIKFLCDELCDAIVSCYYSFFCVLIPHCCHDTCLIIVISNKSFNSKFAQILLPTLYKIILDAPKSSLLQRCFKKKKKKKKKNMHLVRSVLQVSHISFTSHKGHREEKVATRKTLDTLLPHLKATSVLHAFAHCNHVIIYRKLHQINNKAKEMKTSKSSNKIPRSSLFQ